MKRHPKRTAKVCACGDHGFLSLTQGRVAFLSPEDVPAVGQIGWCLSWSGAGGRIVSNDKVGERKVSLGAFLMEPGPGYIADHIDRDPLNNRRSNLRLATQKQNARNCCLPKNNRTGLKGVYERKGRYFYAQIHIDDRTHYVGAYRSPVEAARAYDRAAKSAFGEFAATNESMGLIARVSP